MLQHKATLIQDIQDYLVLLREHITPYFHPYQLTGFTEESAIEWIIAEEIELMYQLFDTNHRHNAEPYKAIHAQLSSVMDLSGFTANYIKAPILYTDNIIEVSIHSSDLHIMYFRDPFKENLIRSFN